MLIITHVRLDGRGRFYENITQLRIETAASTVTADVTKPQAVSVAFLIAQIKLGTKVITNGTPPVEVEVFKAYDREYIRSASSATPENDLLTLPVF